MAKNTRGPGNLIDTLKLSEQRWGELAAKLDKVDVYAVGQRRHERMSYRKLAQIAVAIQHPDGKWGKYIVRSRDLSPGGIGFIHGMYVYAGSACRIILKDVNGNVVCLEGAVKRCELIAGNVHDVGVQFNEQIDLLRFMGEPETDSDNDREAG